MFKGLTTRTQKLVGTALFAAIIFVATAFTGFPIIGGAGYIHFGDAFILLACCILGGWWAVAAAALGSALADVLLGYYVYAPATLIVKGLMALVVVLIGGSLKKNLRTALAFGAGELVMVVGYFLANLAFAGLFVLDGFEMAAAFTALPFDLLQGAVGAVLAFAVMILARRSKLFPQTGLAKSDDQSSLENLQNH